MGGIRGMYCSGHAAILLIPLMPQRSLPLLPPLEFHSLMLPLHPQLVAANNTLPTVKESPILETKREEVDVR